MTSRDRWSFYLYCRQHGIWPKEVAGHDPDRENHWFGPYCPVRNVSAAYPPTLLIHGTADTDVPYEESVKMDGKLSQFKCWLIIRELLRSISGMLSHESLYIRQQRISIVAESPNYFCNEQGLLGLSNAVVRVTQQEQRIRIGCV